MKLEKHITSYKEHGYCVIEEFKSKTETEALRGAALEIVDAFDDKAHREFFSTTDKDKKRGDYFLTSSDKVRCFFEEDAFDPEGKLRQQKALSINKIGHAMHDLNPVFDNFSRDPRCAQIASLIGLKMPQLWQSMYIFKQPRIGGEVRWHQDATYFYTDPISVATFWFAIDDATRENGCLWISKEGANTPLRERFNAHEGEATLKGLSDKPWPSDDMAIPLEVEAGTLVVFHGLLPHYSAPNKSDKARHAYTLHVCDGATNYAGTNWIQRDKNFPVRGFV